MKKILSLIFALLIVGIVYSQDLHSFYFSNAVKVVDENNVELPNPFGGGLKFPVFAGIDLNRDYKLDLVVLDRVDNRVLTFLNTGTGDTIKYSYVPDYEDIFPDSLTSFIILKDYNGDNLKDIFTYSSSMGAGIAVYKNVGNEDYDSFALEVEQLNSYFHGNFSWMLNLPMYSVDIPAIVDYDQDGDLDIMTYDPLGGSYMHLFKNCCQEIYGNSDSFIYTDIDEYWGYFLETDSSFYTLLGYTPPSWLGAYKDVNQNCADIYKVRDDEEQPNFQNRGNGTRHAGSSVFAFDIDGDQDIDVFVGDVEYPRISFLENGRSDYGTQADTIIENHLHFPSYDVPINIKQMPALYPVDVNRDGKDDLIAGPIDMVESDTFENLNQVWLYLNKGTSKLPVYEFQQNNFLQEGMVDLGGATSPGFIDYDADGDQDLFVATRGNYVETFYKKDRIVIYENIGRADSVVYKKTDDDFMNLSQAGHVRMTLSFGDYDGDLDVDMVLGNKNGDIVFYQNTEGQGNPVKFEYDTTFSGFVQSGYSAPCVVDMNHDTLGDLVIGQYYGKLSYYQNTGSVNNASFSLVADTFGGILFSGSYHFTSPAIADLDTNGYLDLVLGNVSWIRNLGYYEGRIHVYKDINKDFNATLTSIDTLFHYSLSKKKISNSPGFILRPAIANLDKDSLPDIILGSERGGLAFFGTFLDTVNVINSIAERSDQRLQYQVYPNPCFDYINIKLQDADVNQRYELSLYDIYGRIAKKQRLNVSELNTISLYELAHGIYIGKLSSGNRSAVFRVVKQ